MRCWTQWWRDWRTLSGGASTARKLWWTRPWWGDTARSTSIAVTHAMRVERKPRPGTHWRFTPEDIMEVELASTTCNTKSCFESPIKYWENSTWLTFFGSWEASWKQSCLVHNEQMPVFFRHLTFDPSYLLFADLNAVLESMIGRLESGSYICNTCGKTSTSKSKSMRHAEVHMNVAHHCMICQKQLKTRNALAIHYSRYHEGEVLSPWTTTDK